MVHKTTLEQVLSDGFGGREKVFCTSTGLQITPNSRTVACALMHCREHDKNDIFSTVYEPDIPQHVKKSFLDTPISTITQKTLRESRTLNLFNFENLIKGNKATEMTMMDLVQFYMTQYQAKNYRVWYFRNIMEETFLAPITTSELKYSLGEMERKAGKELTFYVEISPHAILPLEPSDILLFFRYYDPQNKAFTFLGTTIAKPHFKVPDLFPIALRMLGFPPSTKLVAFLDTNETELLYLDLRYTLCENKITSGGILVFQKAPTATDLKQHRSPVALDVFTHAQKLRVVFSNRDNPSEGVKLRLPRSSSYNFVVQKLSRVLNVNRADIKLLGYNPYFWQTKLHPIQPHKRAKLKDMLTYWQPPHGNSIGKFLHYRIQTEGNGEGNTRQVNRRHLKCFDVEWLDSQLIPAKIYEVLVNKKGKVLEILNCLSEISDIKLGATPQGSGHITIM
eukprot:TRINITY_DN3862_c0_g1_i6.p1 TRINITY_DN3862_c0_g1~~TRINITY_DN3862_c0_g1_i6.p1  ORF type:complete len:451 (+),score=56.12 TRINITY_DN3862_c0_g1_i6:1576-2928(+)